LNDRSLKKAPEPEVLPMTVHGYTLRRKFAIAVWLSLTLVSIATTYLLFSLVAQGIDAFVHVRLALMTNAAFGHSDLAFNIPLMRPARALALAVSIYCGIKTLLKLFIPPPIKTHAVVIHHLAQQAK
jgi:hypothetical protein